MMFGNVAKRFLNGEWKDVLSAKSFMKDLADCFTTENVHIAKDSEQYCF